MSGILRRAKSTRDARAKVTRDQLDFNFAAETENSAPPEAPEVKPQPHSPRKLSRRKSISSFHASLRIGNMFDNIPKTANPLNRLSMVPANKDNKIIEPGGPSASSPESPLLSEMKLSPFPPRQNSDGDGRVKGSERSSNDGFVDDSELHCIGMAIGSPTEYTLPPEPFGVEVRGPMTGALRKKQLQKESKHGAQEEGPKSGWKKLFGRSFFGKKNAPKLTQQSLQLPPARDSMMTAGAGRFQSKTPFLISKSHLNNLAAPPISPAPCLDVDIPEVEMERYSVMFSTLLHPSEKSSLFARRRSRDIPATNGQTQQAVPQLYLSPLKRNATTGQVSRSPRSMLGDSLPNPSPRSGTSPARSPGLARSKTVGGVSPAPSPRTIYVVNSHNTDSSSAMTPASRPGSLRQVSSSKISRISEESSIDTQRGSFDEGDDGWFTKNGEAEPQWEMINPQGQSTQTTPNTSMSEEDIEYAAQISIARQISISQRQLLLPIVPRSQRLVSRAPLRKPPKPPLAGNIMPRSSSTAITNPPQPAGTPPAAAAEVGSAH
ncbi:hypothetical protein L873DRAFT_1223478 [Choiromyces venosus 120613-1]|uniref:Uncharacterized protein n=1 Tax=Choiromyces venosus 120613-1 TaxID=1336337 RepID=A0A3N4JHE8_9PEZI|nr:hypothetical protein L873DRAFT_1223478 [Choiromyces venosus 120613-1]